jgi:4-amino-4-deoxy-L-arabinose transferase-like glycosyltransferase
VHSASTKTYPRLLFFTLALSLVILFWALGTTQLLSLNEGRRALAIKEMYLSGDWLLPHLNGELYLTKPPLLYWISNVFSSISGGVNEWTLRLPSAIAALAVLWMVYRYVLKNFGQWPALFSMQLLIANAGFAMLARRVEIEMLLTALCAGALFSAIHYIQGQAGKFWIYLSYALLGFALLTKGPVVLLFVTLPLLVVAIWTKDARVKQVLLSWQGWALFLLVGLSWYAAVTWQLGPDLWASIAKRDMLGKMQSEAAKPLLSYVAWIAVDFLLLIGLLAIRPKALLNAYGSQQKFLIPMLAILVPVVVFSLFGNKHAKYLLPIYPFIAVILAVQLGLIFNHAGKVGRILILSLGALLPLIFAIYYVFVEARFFDYRVTAFPQFQKWSTEIQPAELYAYREIDSRLIYYSNKPVLELDQAKFTQMQTSKQPFLLLVEDEYINKIAPLADCRVREFKPYLKKHKSLQVFGFGKACSHDLNNIY